MFLKVLICTIFVSFVFGQNWEKCDDHQKCISEILCDAGKVKTDGSGLLETRGNVIKSCGFNKICCQFKLPTAGNIEEYDYGGIFSVKKCGRKGTSENLRTRISNEFEKDESEASLGEFPWMILILKTNPNGAQDKLCGGSLIKPNVVLSTAHNVKNHTAENLVARAGEWDLSTDLELTRHVEKHVINVVIHEDFNPKSLVNDVSLLFLNDSFVMTEHINVICLPSQDFSFDGSKCIATGWGKSKSSPSGNEETILKKVDLPIVSANTCQKLLRDTRLGIRFNLNNSFICAGGELGKDACTGDGGSPLVCPIPDSIDEYYQAGIVSWGIGCGRANVPGVYTNVAMFSDWIEEQVQENELINP